jgi:hypothetical protein
VIRVESLQHFPPTTRGQMPRPPASFMQNASRLQAGYPDWEPGEHNDYVYRDLLGMTAVEVERLPQAGHIGDAYIGV